MRWKHNHNFDQEEVDAIERVFQSQLLSGFIGSYQSNRKGYSFWGGPEIRSLEAEWADLHDCEYAVSFNSATSAILAALGALEIGFGDEVIVSPLTMTACAPMPLFYGAIPKFCDIDPNTGGLCPLYFKKMISPKTRCVILVHQYGFCANIAEIKKIADEHNIFIIEDCAQAYGGKLGGKALGTFGDIGIFSLNVNKAIHAGEGGIATTNSHDLMQKLALIRNHGENVVEFMRPDIPINIVGLNLRLTEIQAAVSRVQLKKLAVLQNQRMKLVNHLKEKLNSLNFVSLLNGSESVYYQFPIRIDTSRLKIELDELVRFFNSSGLEITRDHRPLYHQPLYQKKRAFKQGYPFAAEANRDIETNYSSTLFPKVEKQYSELLIFHHARPPHTIEDMDFVFETIQSAESFFKPRGSALL